MFQICIQVFLDCGFLKKFKCHNSLSKPEQVFYSAFQLKYYYWPLKCQQNLTVKEYESFFISPILSGITHHQLKFTNRTFSENLICIYNCLFLVFSVWALLDSPCDVLPLPPFGEDMISPHYISMWSDNMVCNSILILMTNFGTGFLLISPSWTWITTIFSYYHTPHSRLFQFPDIR